MREIKNNTLRHLEIEEFQAILECSKILEKAFKKKIFVCTVNADQDNRDDVYGVMWCFDKHHHDFN